MQDTFIPEDVDIEVDPELASLQETPLFPNLADDEELSKQVLEFIGHNYKKHESNREPYEDVWKVADWMFKCGQDASTYTSEQNRTDKTAGNDKMKTTKAQKVGSSVFFRSCQTLAGLFSDIVRSVKMPVKLVPVVNPNIPFDEDKADEEVTADNLLLQQTIEWDGVQAKLIELAMMLVKYGNIPIFIEWKKKVSEVLQWVEREDGTKILDRVKTITANYPSLNWILPENIYLDPNIGDIQKQQCILIKCLVCIGDIISDVEAGELINFDDLDKKYLYQGDNTSIKVDKQNNSGLSSTIDDVDTGTFVRFDVHCMLPIDETKPKGSRWDAKKHIPNKFWVTVITSDRPESGLVMRIQRSRDPDDMYPLEMLSWMPDDTDQAFKVSLSQLQRGNYSEATTSKLQTLDTRTQNNNRPIKIRKGAVRMADGSENFKWDKDAVFICEDDINKDIGVEAPINVPDNINTMQYLDSDSSEIAGTGAAIRGDAMGSRTSSTEASNAYNAAARPHMMKFRYIFEKLFGFYASKVMRYWQVYGDEEVMVRASGKGRTVLVNPRALSTRYDTEVICVDEFEKNSLQQDKFAFAARTMIPIFQGVLDMRKMAKKAFSEVLDWDVTSMILADDSKEESVEAKYENGVLQQGRYIPINADDNDAVHIQQHSGERVRYNGLEKDPRFAWLPLLDRHIEEHKVSQANKAQRAASVNQAQQGMASPEAPSGNQTLGQSEGNQIAATLGAINGGS